MVLLTQILTFILIISILVVLHEFGHYLPAKYFKTRVEKFYLFFDVKFSLFKKKIGETEFGIGWLPLGGYVKISGMIDESMDTEQMKKDPEPWEFRSKPAWQRLIIMLGGVTVNFFLAWFIYSGLLFSNGDTYIPSENLKYGILVDSVGQKLGLQTGDKILAIDGKKSVKFTDAAKDILFGDEITVNRNGEKLTIPISDEGKKDFLSKNGSNFLSYRMRPFVEKTLEGSGAENAGIESGDLITAVNGEAVMYYSDFIDKMQNFEALENINITVDRSGVTKLFDLKLSEDKKAGIYPSVADLRVTDSYSFLASIPAGFNQTIKVLTDQVRQFKIIFNRTTEGYKQLKGPIGIVEMMAPTWDWYFFWNFLAYFSIWLAFVNLLPIPALDGGHVMFLLYEIISGRAPSEKVLERGQIIGFVIIMTLMVVIFGNDIWNVIKRFI